MKQVFRLLTCIFLLNISGVHAATKNQEYNIDNIPEVLKSKADAVILSEKTTLDIHSNYFKRRVQLTITILNEEGHSFANFVTSYDKNSKVKVDEIIIYDAKGDLVKELDSKDIIDVAASGSSTMLTDNRIMYTDITYNKYPFTVHMDYTTIDKSTIHYPGWYPIKASNISCVSSIFELRADDLSNIRFKEINPKKININKDETNDGVMFFRCENIQAVSDEEFSGAFKDNFYTLNIAPKHFVFDGTKGSLENWNTLGLYMHNLRKEKNIISYKTKSFLDSIKEVYPDKVERAKYIYQYMQKKTRYISIQLGVGGYQPFEATLVEETGYGDCKALTNYTVAMLNYSGVDAIYSAIGNGNLEIKYDDWASVNQANHVIACLPLDQDTIWLECTSKTAPFGYIGASNSNRKALLITENGGKLVNTNKLDSTNNFIKSIQNIEITEDGIAKIEKKIVTSGELYDRLSYFLINERSDKGRREYLEKRIKNDNVEIESFEINETRKRNPEVNLNLILKHSGITRSYNDSYIIRIPRHYTSIYVPDRSKNRYSNVEIKNEKLITEEVLINAPENFTWKTLPENQEIKSKFGKFSISYHKVNNEKISVKSSFALNSGNYAPEEYNAFRNFLRKCYKGLNQKINVYRKTVN